MSSCVLIGRSRQVMVVPFSQGSSRDFLAVIAMGCSIGQGLSAFSLLAFSAPVTFAAIFAGAAVGLRQLIVGFAPVSS